MKSVTKKLPIAVAIATALSLSFVTVHQSGVIQGLKKTLGITEAKLDKTEKALVAERELTKSLQEEKEVLIERIDALNLEVAQLNEKIADQKATIHYQNKKIQKLEDNVSGLTKQISTLKSKRKVDIDKIKELTDERDRILIKMEEFDRERAKEIDARNEAIRKKRQEQQQLQRLNAQKAEVENQLAIAKPTPQPKKEVTENQPLATTTPNVPNGGSKTEVKISGQEKIRKIVTGTSVKYHGIKLSMKDDGKPLDKLKKNGWKSTMIEVNLNNADNEAIIGEEFIVQVFDLDNNKVIPVNESNARYPNSSQGSLGYKFTYEGKPLKINYFNTQKKTGSNYEIRLFYTKGGVLLPLKNGTLRIVKDGKVM